MSENTKKETVSPVMSVVLATKGDTFTLGWTNALGVTCNFASGTFDFHLQITGE